MTKRTVLGALIAAALTMPQAVSGQLLGLTQWNSGPGANNHYYAMTQFAGDFREVSAIAASYGGTLVAINSAEENQWVYDTFSPLGTCSPVWCLPSTFYIGLERVAPGGPFAWQSGEELSFTAWNVNEPNNGGGNEQAVHLFYGRPGSPARGAAPGAGEVIWNDIPYDRYPMRGLVELRTVGVTEPGTLMLLLTGMLGLGFVARRRKEASEAL